MIGSSVAKRYSIALLRVAQEEGSVDRVQTQLDQIVKAIKEVPSLGETLESPIVAPSKKRAICTALAEKWGFGKTLQNFFWVLIDQDRMENLPLISLVFRDLADEALGQVRVRVKSAAPLGEEEAHLKAILERDLKRKVLLEVQLDPQLLGGLSIQVGDKVFDGSLRKQLESLKQEVIRKAVA